MTRNFAGRLRLRHQMLAWLALVLVLVVTVPVLQSVMSWRLEAVARQHTQQWAHSLPGNAAEIIHSDLATGDLRTLDARLSNMARLPGLSRIKLADVGGQTWRSYTPISLGLVAVTGRAPEVSGAAELEAARAPVNTGLEIRDVSVAVSPAEERTRLAGLLDDMGLALGLVTLGAVLLLYGALARALQPLQRLARFSRRITTSEMGTRLANEGGSAEVQELRRALNDASQSIRAQLEATRATEERTALLIHAAPDALLALDSQGRVTLINHAVTSVLGCTSEQILGQSVDWLLPGLDAERLERATLDGVFMRSTGMHLARFETPARRHDGTEFPAEASISRVQTVEGTRYACVVRDLTEQRMTMSMLQLDNQALECTTNGVVISDMSLPGQPVFYANPAFTRISGYQVWEAIGRNCSFLQGEDHAQPELAVVRQAIEKRESVTVVLRNYRKDGSLFFNELALAPVSAADGSVRHYVGIQTDVSERERSRLALAERNARLNAVFDLSPDGYAVFDRDGVLVFGNEALRHMTGWSEETLATSMSMAAFDARFAALCDPSRPYRALSALHGDGGHSLDTDDLIELQRPQRRTLTRLARLNIDGRGESILYFRDVTREMEVDRMKSEFLTTAAHELRTPMVSVFGFTELLLNRPVPETRRRDVLETIHRQASLLISMVNQLLDLARIEARMGKDLDRKPVPLGPLLHDAVAAFMAKDDPRQVLMDVPHAHLVLQLDAEKTHRALNNVISNAFKYSPQGGEIRLSTLDGLIDQQPAVGIRVSDRGMGMSLVKEVTELHGGRVEVTSALGLGTQVTLWFPRAPAARLAAPSEQAQA
jgi:PAS domain S-box-containing protein